MTIFLKHSLQHHKNKKKKRQQKALLRINNMVVFSWFVHRCLPSSVIIRAYSHTQSIIRNYTITRSFVGHLTPTSSTPVQEAGWSTILYHSNQQRFVPKYSLVSNIFKESVEMPY